MKQKMDQYLQELRESTAPAVENLKSQMSKVGQDIEQTFVNFGVGLGQDLKNEFISFWETLTKRS